MDNFYIDEDCVVSFWVGEFGWWLQYWQGYLRYLKQKIYPDHKFIVFCSPHLHVFVNDFVYATVDLPDWFKEAGFESDCYEAVIPESPSGSLMPPDAYAAFIADIRRNYNNEKAIEIWPPRGCNFWINNQLQVFCQYKTDKKHSDKHIVVVFPRARARAAVRNIPEFVWYGVVEALRQHFTVVLAGTPSGACLVDYEEENVINLINYNEQDKSEKIITWLNSAICSISSQSGGTHMSLLSNCPSYIIGHERQRHTEDLNRLKTATSFRNLVDYRAIDSQTILDDVATFINRLNEAGWVPDRKAPEEVLLDDTILMHSLIKEQRGEV